MRTSWAAAVVLLVVVLGSCQGDLLTRGQSERFNAADIKRLLMDRGYVQKQLNCVLYDEECDDVGNHLKRMIPEVIIKNCASCTPQEAQTARNIINYIKSKYPNEWEDIQSKATSQ